jgi:hypothetical protein
MHAPGQLLERCAHFMAGRAERDGRGVVQGTEKPAGKAEAHDERQQSPGRYA